MKEKQKENKIYELAVNDYLLKKLMVIILNGVTVILLFMQVKAETKRLSIRVKHGLRL